MVTLFFRILIISVFRSTNPERLLSQPPPVDESLAQYTGGELMVGILSALYSYIFAELAILHITTIISNAFRIFNYYSAQIYHKWK